MIITGDLWAVQRGDLAVDGEESVLEDVGRRRRH